VSSKTTCGHDITVRCLKCTGAEWDPIQPRRWAVLSKRSAALVREKIKPEEARLAVASILVNLCLRLEQIREYDQRKDEFVLLVRHSDGRLDDAWIPGEAIAKAVITARAMAPKIMTDQFGKLTRPSEKRKAAV
jgi:hypothetical protein